VTSDPAPSDTEATFRGQHDGTFARFQKLYDGEDAAWRVLTSDGMTYFFGEESLIQHDGDVGGAAVPPHFSPLTRIVDPFGNTVTYTWHVDGFNTHLAPFAVRSIRLVVIKYSSNPGAGIDAHSRVVFNYGSLAYCNGSSVPIGASVEVVDPDDDEVFDHQTWYEGAHPLESIDIWVDDSPTALARRVRRYLLGVNDFGGSGGGEPEVCGEDHGAFRVLEGITEIGDPGGLAVELPPVEFSYAWSMIKLAPMPI
jgi:hypothetical protein